MMVLNILDAPQSIMVSHGVLLKLIVLENLSDLIGKTVVMVVMPPKQLPQQLLQ